MLPVIAIVGRPNVGKSTLFNYLTKSRDALVADFPGLTRDRQYGEGFIDEQGFIVIDTGGIGDEEMAIDSLAKKQSWQAVAEADLVLLLVDGRAGLTAADEAIAAQLRQSQKQILLVVNKIEGIDPEVACSEFHILGFGEPLAIAAAHGRNVKVLTRYALSLCETAIAPNVAEQQPGIKLAIVGRPNVGKSTLVNRMLGEERVVVFDAPGTTRDSIFIPLERQGKQYTLIDTAGVRRKAKINQAVEKFSVVKTLQAIASADVVITLIDAKEGITEQDLHLLGFVLNAGKAVVIAVNKWDGMATEEKDWVRKELQRRLVFVDFAEQHFISALHGTGVGDLFKSAEIAYQSATKSLATAELTRILEQAVEAHQPPLAHGRRIKLRYAHAGGHQPPLIVIHGNQTQALPASYQRYLINTYRKKLKLVGTPIRLELKTSDNPYKDKKNKLTPRQERRRKRFLRHVKKK